jgi:hypothetical protein
MLKIDVYYDYTDEGLSPRWMVINFGTGKLDWTKKYVYLPVQVPYKRKTAEEFIDVEMGLTITLVDLVMNADKEGCFGVHLTSVKDRVNKMRGRGEFPYTLDEVETFIIQICDIEDVLAIDGNELYTWR